LDHREHREHTLLGTRSKHWFPRGARHCLGVLDGFDAPPFIGLFGVTDRPVGNSESIWAPKLRVASPALFGDFHEAQSTDFPQGWGNCVSVHAELNELVERDRQPAIIIATMVRLFDFYSGENAMPRKAQHLKSRRFHHLDGACRELAENAVPAARVVAHAAPRRDLAQAMF
jgi:hypothetical protein